MVEICPLPDDSSVFHATDTDICENVLSQSIRSTQESFEDTIDTDGKTTAESRETKETKQKRNTQEMKQTKRLQATKGAQDRKKANLNAGDSNVHRIKDILSDYIAAKCLPISGAKFSGDCRGFRHALLRDLREMDVQQLYFHLGSNDILTNEAVFYRQFSTYKRAGSEVKKKYYNMKDKTKTKNDEMRRPGTGGGPRVKEFTIPEGILLQHFGDSASVAGVPNAIDTDAPEGASINIIELGKMPIDGSTCMTFKIDERGLGAQKTSSVFQRAVEDEAGPCSSGTKTNTKSMKMANKNQSKRARASFNKLAEDNLIAEKKNIHLQQVNLRLKNQLILAQLKVARLTAQKIEEEIKMLKASNEC
ncbi:uncharacterized protein LOC127840418 [Dreissena polymorpha]|nr:uncharacterized protein LOC127840418 [Dreissena polymorpha]